MVSLQVTVPIVTAAIATAGKFGRAGLPPGMGATTAPARTQQEGQPQEPAALPAQFATLLDEVTTEGISTASVPQLSETNKGLAQAATSTGSSAAEPEGGPAAANQRSDPARGYSLPVPDGADTETAPVPAPPGTETPSGIGRLVGTGLRLGKPDRTTIEKNSDESRNDVVAFTIAATPARLRLLAPAQTEDRGSSSPGVSAVSNQQTGEAPELLGPEAVLEIRLHLKEPNNEASTVVNTSRYDDAQSSPLQMQPLPQPAPPGRSAELPPMPTSVPMEVVGPDFKSPEKNDVRAIGAQLDASHEMPHAVAEVLAEPTPDHAKLEPEVRPRATAEAAAEIPAQTSRTPPQTLRSLALEFTPDGAQDVRVRVTQRAGDVHISLHSADDSLNGRLREGVHELVGSLTSAGYDADAWTSRHGRNQESPQERPQQGRNGRTNKSGTEEFSGLIDQTTQEKL